MGRILGWSLVGAVMLLVPLATGVRAADDKDKKIPLDKVPKPIREAIDGRFPGADVSSVEKETENGKVMFDVELKHQGRKYEMDIAEDGTIIEIEKEVAQADVPESVTNTIKARFPGATIKEVMEVNKVKGKQETPDHYEVTIEMPDKKTREINLSLQGKLLKKEAEKKEEK
jgi:uncharacterized membrane protein YkoI